MKAVFFTDPHIQGTNFRSRKDFYPDTIQGKLREVISLANSLDGILICGGDLFHRHNVAISTVRDTIEVIQLLNRKPMYMVLGNHDIYGHNPSVVGKTMAGLLEITGLIKLLEPDNPITIVDGTVSINITGVPYHAGIDDNPDCYRIAPYSLKGSYKAYSVHVVHGYLTNGAWPTYNKHILVNDVRTNADVVLTGHVHSGYGVISKGNSLFCNPGALGRVSARIEELDRKPLVAVLNFSSSVQISLVEISAKPGEEVLDRTRIEEERNKVVKAAEFKAKLKEKIIAPNLENILEEVSIIENVDALVKEEAKARITKVQERLGN